MILHRDYFTDKPSLSGYNTGLTRLYAYMGFDNYMMFKYDNNSIYIPLSKIDWYWQAEAKKNTSGTFGITIDRVDIIGPADVTGNPINNLPEWNRSMN